MAIQFQCPSCRQPIEIDDEWANQEVSCPFCRKVVTAPTTSTWVPARIPQAGLLTPPPPPFGMPDNRFGPPGTPPAPRRMRPFGTWAFLLTIGGWILIAATMILGTRFMMPIAERAYDSGLSRAEQQQRVLEAIQQEMAKNPRPYVGIVAGLFLGIGCLIAGLIVSLVGWARREINLFAGIATIALSVLPLLCLCLSMFSSLARNL